MILVVTIQPFTINVSQTVLDDLMERLARARWIDGTEKDAWEYGLDAGYLKELVAYWRSGYKWREQEAALNRYPHFKSRAGGVEVHYIHVRSSRPGAIPVLLLHGFPDSFYRYHKVINPLANPGEHGLYSQPSFDVVVASIPGFGFSDRVALDAEANGELFFELMTRVLGYTSFVAAGGDWGSMIIQSIARKHPEALMGMHLTDVGYPDATTDFSSLSPAEMQMAQWVQKWWMEEGVGVNTIMATKPQTLAYSLNDSPVGLAAWLIGYASSGEKGRNEFKQRFSQDELLTNVMIYWVSQSIGSAMRTYFENARSARQGPRAAVVSSVPACIAHCPYDPPLPREWAERRVNVVRFTEFPRGGHFMAWEEPQLYVEDLRAFGSKLLGRKSSSLK
jgi:epoxide hydrolase